MPLSMDEFIRKYASGSSGNPGTPERTARQESSQGSAPLSMEEFISRYATSDAGVTRRTVPTQTQTTAPERAASTAVVPEAEQRRQNLRETAGANRTNARTSYTDLRNTRDSIKAKADDMKAEYDQKISAGASKEELADEYARIMKQYGIVTDYDKRVEEAYAALQQADQEYKDVYADYNAARQEVKAAKRNLRDVESQYAGWATDDLSAQNVEQAMNNAEDVKAARTRLANAREAYIAQGGNPDANIIGSNAKSWGGQMLGTVRYMQDLHTPGNEINVGPFAFGRSTIQGIPAEVQRQAVQEQARRTEETAARLQRESTEEINSMKAGRSELGQFGIDVAGQGVQMGLDAATGKIIPGGSLTSMALRTFGSGAQEAKDAGATLAQQGLYGAGTAAVEVLTEKMFDGLAGVYGAGAADDIVSHAIGRFTQNRLGQAALGMVADAAGEGLEEVISDLANPILRSIYDEHVFDNGYFGALNGEEILYDFLVGAAMGFVGGSVEGVTKATGISAEDERSKFFMQAGENGMKIGDAMRMWQKHMLKEGYATQTGDQSISNRAAELEQAIDEKKFDLFRERKINRLNQRAATTASREDMRNTLGAVEQRMQQLGENNSELAEAVTMVALEGEAERIGARDMRSAGSVTATEEQRRMVAASPIAQRVLSEMNVENLRGEQAASAANDILAQMGVSSEELQRNVAPYQRTNEWVKKLRGNKALASDVYGTQDTVTAEEKAALKVGGQTAKIVGAEDGKAIVEQNGTRKTVGVDEIDGIGRGYRKLVAAAANGVSGEAMLRLYNPGQDVDAYTQAWNYAENVYGAQTDVSLEKARMEPLLRALTDEQLKLALEIGRGRRAAAQKETQSKAETRKATTEKAKGTVQRKKGTVSYEGGEINGVKYKGADRSKFNRQQKRVAAMVEALADAVNLDYLIVDGEANTGGCYIQGGTVVVNINSGALSGKTLGAATLSHELTHHLQDYAPEQYEELKDFIVGTFLAKSPEQFDRMVKRQIALEPDLSYDTATDEVIANACQKMLLNSKAVEQLARQNMTLAERIADWISETADKIKAAFEDVDLNDNISIYEPARAIEGVMDEVQKLWDKALIAANENYNAEAAAGKKNTAGNGGVQRQTFENEYTEYNKPITADDVIQLRSIGRKSVNRFTSEDLKKAQKWATKYFQQMGVKSPFFRAWFGEWRSRSESPVSTATIPRYEKTNEFRKSLRGTYDNADTGWSVAVSREGESNTISHAGSEKLSEFGLAGIKSLIENAVLLDTEVHEHHSNNAANELIAFDHRLYALGENEQGEIGLYRITVEEYYQSKKQQNEKRFHNLKHIEKIADIAGRRTYDQRRSGGSANGDSAITYSIADLYAFVKKYDSDFNVNEHDNVSPTLLNQDGTPRVVFHSTDAKNIDVFQSGNSAGIIYFAFTEKEAKYAARGTKYVRPYYLSISNPLNTPDTAIAWYNAEDSSKVGQWRRQGYDAVFVNDEAGVSVAVFSPEQVKSATDNIGTFDSNNPDVRFQMFENSYMEAVEKKDTAAAQKFVDQAAKAAGYTYHGYHGTLATDFTEFKKEFIGTRFSFDEKGFFFIDRESIAKDYATSEFDGGKKGRVIDAYLKIRKPFIVDKAFAMKDGLGNIYRDNDVIDVWDNYSSYFLEVAEEQKADGIILDDGGTKMFIVFDGEQIKSAEPVTYDNKGEVIPLSKRFNNRSRDFRFQKWGIGETEAEQRERKESFDAIKAQNKILKARADYWRGQTRQTKENTVRQQDTDRLANELLREYSSRAEKDEVKTALKELGDWLVRQNGESLSYDELYRRARSIAEDVIDGNYALLDDSNKENLDRLKDFLKGTALNLSASDWRDTGDENFRRRYGRYFSVSESGRSIDSAWGELAGMFGEGLFPEDVYAPGDMLNMIGDYLDLWRPQYGNEFEQNRGEAVEWATGEIIDRMLSEDVRQTPGTFADKAQQKLNAQIAKDREKLDALRAQKNARIDQLRREAAAKNQAIRTAEKAAKYEAVSKVKQHYLDMMQRQRARRSDTAVRGKIKKLHKELTDMLLHPTEKRYVPRELVKATAEILSAIDTTTGKSEKASAAFAELKVKYDALKGEKDFAMVYDETVSEMLQKLAAEVGNGTIYDLSGEALEAVYNTLHALKHTIREANRLTASEIEATAFEAANAMMNETSSAKAIDQKILRKWIFTQATPESMFRMLGSYRKGSMWEQMFRMLNRGQLKQTQILMEGGNIFRELIDDKQLKTLHDQKNLVDIGLKDAEGNPVKITRGMMLSVYMHLENEQNAQHVSYGGFTVPRLKPYYQNKIADAFSMDTVRTATFSEEIAEINRQLREAETQEEKDALNARLEEIRAESDAMMGSMRSAIEKELTDYDRAWIQAAKYFFDVYSKGKLNETTQEVYGFDKAQVDNYFPIHTDPKYRQANFDTITRDMSLENAGFMKERQHGSNPILLEDITDVINSQLQKTAQYCGLMPAIRNFNKVYGKARAGYENSVQAAVGKRFGDEGLKYIENLMADLSGARRGESNIFDELRGKMAGAALSVNLRVTMSQAASFPTAAAEIGYKPLAKALADVSRNPIWNREASEEIAKWTPLWWYRMQGFSVRELGDIKNAEQFMGKVNDRMKWLTGWIQAADGWTTGALWNAAKYYVDDNFTDLERGSDEYMMKVAEVYNRVIERTQPDYTTLQRPDILRNPNAVVKQLTMFLTQRLQNTNLVYDAARQYAQYVRDAETGRDGVTREDVKQAKTRLIWAVSSQVVASATIVLFKGIADVIMHSMNAYRDDDDELTAESVSKTLLKNFVETLTSNVLWGSEVYSALRAAISGDRYYGISLNGVETFTDAVSSAVTFVQTIGKGDKDKLGKAALNLAKAAGQFFGLPVSNFVKWGQMIVYHAQDIAQGTVMEAGVDWLTDSKQARYEEYGLKKLGINEHDVASMMREAEQNGKNGLSQEETGNYLKQEMKAGRLTKKQASALWWVMLNQVNDSTKSFEDWLKKNP